jgi:transposase
MVSSAILIESRRYTMKRLEIQDREIMRLALQDEIQRSDESRYDHRLHGVLLVASGKTCSEVAGLFGQSRRTVQYWVKRFDAHGFAGLQERQRSGRPSLLTEGIKEKIGYDLRRSPRDIGYGQNLWDGKMLSHHLAKTYSLQLGARQCQRLFHNLGFRRRKPRPVIARADGESQLTYKKTDRDGE